MSELRIGNVIEAPGGSKWIVTEVDDKVVQAVAFEAENVSAAQRLDDWTDERTCHCGDHPDFEGEPQEDCDQCHGTGRYTMKYIGWKHSKVLAPHVKAFIEKGIKRVFQL